VEQVGSIAPHGGILVDRRWLGKEREEALNKALRLPQILLGPMGLADLEMIATGAMSPLTGFMCRADYERVVAEMRLTSGMVWSIPVTLPVSAEQAASIQEGQEVALVESGGHVLAVMTVQEKYGYDKRREAREVYRTEEDKHPGVARLYKQGDVLLGGPVWLVDMPANREFIEFRHAPIETRRMFDRRGWKTIVAFQTRNPIHRSHEYIQKTALEIVDGLLLHPLVGETQASDIPADVRMASYQAILRDYYPPDRVLLGVFPAAMRYAGPREAIFHALCRKNYGCTHFIVGRDHAGVGKYYGTYDAQKMFDNFDPDEIGIAPLMFENTFYCKKCGGIVSAKTCPHGDEDHLIFSGTEVRRRLETGKPIPPEFTRPEVYRVLVEGMRAKRGEADQPPVASSAPAAALAPAWGGRKVLVIGLDCAEPSLVFDRWREELPNLNQLMSGGVYGNLESCIPAITVPAWSVMMSSRDPGQLGIYGFRNRADYSYDKMTIATGSAVKADRVWDILSRAGKQVVVVGVPGTYPPRPVNGALVSCFLTPNTTKSQYTYPPELKDQIAAWVGEYQVDVPQFRTEDKDFLLKQIDDMTDQHFVVNLLEKSRGILPCLSRWALIASITACGSTPIRRTPSTSRATSGRRLSAITIKSSMATSAKCCRSSHKTRSCSSSLITAPRRCTAASPSTSGSSATGGWCSRAKRPRRSRRSKRSRWTGARRARGAAAATMAACFSTCKGASRKASSRRAITSACATN